MYLHILSYIRTNFEPILKRYWLHGWHSALCISWVYNGMVIICKYLNSLKLPHAFPSMHVHVLTQMLFRFFGIMATAAVSTPFAIAPVVAVIILFLLMRWFFLRSSRELKRLEALGEFVSVLYCKKFFITHLPMSIWTNSTQSLILPPVYHIEWTSHHSFLLHAVWQHGTVSSVPESTHAGLVFIHSC